MSKWRLPARWSLREQSVAPPSPMLVIYSKRNSFLGWIWFSRFCETPSDPWAISRFQGLLATKLWIGNVHTWWPNHVVSFNLQGLRDKFPFRKSTLCDTRKLPSKFVVWGSSSWKAFQILGNGFQLPGYCIYSLVKSLSYSKCKSFLPASGERNKPLNKTWSTEVQCLMNESFKIDKFVFNQVITPAIHTRETTVLIMHLGTRLPAWHTQEQTPTQQTNKVHIRICRSVYSL